ncbi:28S ribosomal protein S22, mitochondrial [Frieseomelitta varia]|uniref:28S ribosomal protein S22, mitochondrial n=1 Tax=Frieseomelitta varia TaxID=561572 RepID=UPI001CB6B5D3|nr:28S ribosomal protein S22, mitochondrial [Frieseomelitta varia]
MSARIEVRSIHFARTMYRRINFLLKDFYRRPTWNCRLCSTAPRATDERDPRSFFFDQHVQKLLKTLTRIDYEKVFATRRDETRLKIPEFKFMTDEELAKAREEIGKKANRRIQMPPVVKIRPKEPKVLVKEPELQGCGRSNLVFTDISFGKSNRNRIIVVRETNGTLRHANSSERHRMNQIYFPITGREMHTPQMFFNPYLKDLLDQGEFEFILDRACLQFEPDDPEYHRVTKEVYSYVNKLRKFDGLRSTRHFGPLVFQLAWENNIDTLLMELMESENIEEAGQLVRLYHKLHPDAKSGQGKIRNELQLVKLYVELDSSDRHMLSGVLLKYEKMYREKQRIERGIMKAHGLIDDQNEKSET